MTDFCKGVIVPVEGDCLRDKFGRHEALRTDLDTGVLELPSTAVPMAFKLFGQFGRCFADASPFHGPESRRGGGERRVRVNGRVADAGLNPHAEML